MTAEPTRRDVLYIATGAVGAVGVGAVAWPLISQMNPDASTIAAGAPVELDVGPIAEGQTVKVKWRGKIIFVTHRTKAEIEEARAVQLGQLPDPQTD
ncbi:MAG: ubiquinol-cytochrome c reductase iron-sulfur subunit, partial [Methylobacteriaceae bacterium]|nr:ubiquinol-cytochrome c reductase iron-sulfur subunit [Methylobacteriaceae bacterium]